MADVKWECGVCKRADCDDDCEELQLIYRQRQREIAEELAGEEPVPTPVGDAK